MKNELPKEPGAYWYINTKLDKKPYVIMLRLYLDELAYGNCKLGNTIRPYEFYSERIPEPELF